jgi:hypothetical protein
MERGDGASGAIHYYVWFSFRPGVPPNEGLQRVRTFLDEMTGRGVVQEFRLLRNRSAADKAREFQAAIMFADADAFARSFEVVEHEGVRAGLHGLMIAHVQDFSAVVFEDVTLAGPPASPPVMP